MPVTTNGDKDQQPLKSLGRLLFVLLGIPSMMFLAWETGDKVPAPPRTGWMCALIGIATLGALAAFLAERARERVLAHRLLRRISVEHKTAQSYHIATGILWGMVIALLPVPYALVAGFLGWASVACFYMW